MSDTTEIRDNSGSKREVFRLPSGAQLRCKKTKIGLDDIGFSGLTAPCVEFEKGKIYSVSHRSTFGGTTVSYVSSETNCLYLADTSLFEKI